MKQAMIFAAGLGTRLRPLTDTMPKALVTVAGQPLLCHVLQKMSMAGITRLVVNVHHFANQIIEFLNITEYPDLDIRISDESEMLLETGGGIKKARPLFDENEPVLIHNVDILSNAQVDTLYNSRADATLLVSDRPSSRRLLFNDDMLLVGWKNMTTGEIRSPHPWVKGADENNQLQRLAFSGIHLLSPSLFPIMDEWPERFPIIDFYLSTCATHKIKAVVQQDLRLLDVGKIDSLTQAEQFIMSN
ncbi:MAG: NTP transferase domain-containing protein [Prevotella sp.]|nr:NTP transferase domain-containing protein [Prevotella sp.]